MFDMLFVDFLVIIINRILIVFWCDWVNNWVWYVFKFWFVVYVLLIIFIFIIIVLILDVELYLLKLNDIEVDVLNKINFMWNVVDEMVMLL